MSKLRFLFIVSVVLPIITPDVNGQDLGFGQLCTVTNNCRYDYSCIDGRCECRFPRHQNYDYATDRCISLLLAPCTETVDGEVVDIPCGQYAECRNETGFPECMCRPGTRQSNRFCRAEFGEPCAHSSDCFNPTLFGNNAMICKNERCDCGDLEVFDEANDRCVGLVGALCGSGYICVEGAVCERFDSFDGICRCAGAFTPTANRRCGLSQCRGL